MLLTRFGSDEGAGVPGGERILFGSFSFSTRVVRNVLFNTNWCGHKMFNTDMNHFNLNIDHEVIINLLNIMKGIPSRVLRNQSTS